MIALVLAFALGGDIVAAEQALAANQPRDAILKLGGLADAKDADVRALIVLGRAFLANDCSLAEINPLVVTKQGELLALDANTGQNAIRQAQEFARAVDVTSIVLSKLDGSAKGGVVLGIARELGIPVRYIGMGEQIGDLYDFDAEAFAKALFAPSNDAPTDAP